MEFNLAARTAQLGVGEFSDFTLGPREGSGGGAGLWRAQLGTHWHQMLRVQTAGEHADAEFEVHVVGSIVQRGWTFTFTGRIDQLLRSPAGVLLREIKTVTHPLPTPERDLRADHPEYFVQIATYAALARLGTSTVAPPGTAIRAELVFVEAGSGLAQTVPLTPADESLFEYQLERVTDFLNLRWHARERLRRLRFNPAFIQPRVGQETTRAELTAAFSKIPVIYFEAPTGFGKTGVLLEFALDQLRSGNCERVLYLTSKSTGQLQVVQTLARMTTPSAPGPVDGKRDASDIYSVDISDPRSGALAVWHVRNKGEHCINDTFHCVRENCAFLDDVAGRWGRSGLSRFYRGEHLAPDLQTLREAGRDARICPYEITRASLAFHDVWIGDYNYVFAPNNRNLFYLQPGFAPGRTLLIVDEAHNLPSRVADAYSHIVRSDDARAVLAELDHLRVPRSLLNAWESWTLLVAALPATERLDPALEADASDVVQRIADELANVPIDYAALGPRLSELLWQLPGLAAWLNDATLQKLIWTPRAGELHFTCIDAADTIGATLGAFGGVVLASATLGPPDAFAEGIGLGSNTSADRGSLELGAGISGSILRAATPWREGAYDVAVDARVHTTYQSRSKYFGMTAATIAALQEAAAGPVAIFFPSYAYAEAIVRELERDFPALRPVLQPRLRDLAAQSAWVDESLALADALFLVLGSSFAEAIDSLGGRITHAMVVGPALPEVNALQRARVAGLSRLSSSAAFRRVYQIPGIAKVNQALGRLVRAPGQKARIILHCRRFLEASYASLLAPEYQFGANILEDADLERWLENRPADFDAVAQDKPRE